MTGQKPLTLEELATRLAEHLDISRLAARKVIVGLADVTHTALQEGHGVRVPGLGTFTLRPRTARVTFGRTVAARRVPHFHFTDGAREALTRSAE